MIVSAFHWAQLLHPLAGNGYQFWSGIGSDAGELTLLGALVVLIRRHTCHVDGCRSVVTRLDPSVHAPACGRHHSLRHRRGLDPHAERS